MVGDIDIVRCAGLKGDLELLAPDVHGDFDGQSLDILAQLLLSQ